MQSGRVVDITFDEGGFGSGYLLSGSLVLTARHVGDALPVGAKCRVRPLKDIADERSGVLEWHSAHWDGALIRIEGPGFEISGAAARFGIPVPGEGLRYSCDATGFPLATRIREVREEFEATGELSVSERGNAYYFNVDIAPQGNEWSGFSGAAVFNGEKLVGIVEGNADAFNGRRLRIVPITLLLDDPGFTSLVFDPLNWPKRVEQMRPRDYRERMFRFAKANFYQIDREPQCTSITSHLRKTKLPRPIVIYGFDADLHRLFVERLARAPFLKELVGDAEPEHVIKLVGWPKSVGDDVDSALADLDDAVARAAGVESGTNLEAHLSQLPKPVVIWTRINCVTYDANQPELLRRWFDRCVSLAATSKLIVLICGVNSPGPELQPASGLQEFAPRHFAAEMEAAFGDAVRTAKVSKLEWLRAVNLEEDFGDWLDTLSKLENGGMQITGDLLDEFRTQVTEAVADIESMPLRSLLNAITKCFEGVDNVRSA